MNQITQILSAEQEAQELKRCFSIVERLLVQGSQVELVQEIKSILAVVNNSLLAKQNDSSAPDADQKEIGKEEKQG